MKLTNCENCGRMFSNSNEHTLCSKCRLEVVDHFKIVREYVYDHPGARVNDVVEGTGVTKKEVLKYLREGKLELKNKSSELSCQKCGKAIQSGKFCASCASELRNGFNDAIKKDNKKSEENNKPKGWHTSKK